MAVSPVETYLKGMRDIRATGAQTDETSFYTPLANLLNEIGRKLKPKVRCVMNLKNQGAGLPDGGLFTAGQFRRKADADPLPGQKPERGAIEVKSTADSVDEIARGKQVSRYLAGYGLVLVTNYRDFVLARRDESGAPVLLEGLSLARSEELFWEAAQHPRAMAEKQGERLVEYLKRVMLHAASLAKPQDVAWFLASYARDARVRVEKKASLPALAAVRSALEEGLGLKFEGEEGEHFFRSTLVQTLFYGMFSAWVLWRKERRGKRRKPFNWQLAGWSLRVPVNGACISLLAVTNKDRIHG